MARRTTSKHKSEPSMLEKKEEKWKIELETF
jgi:hypothetical protein